MSQTRAATTARQQQGEESRRRILEAATELMTERGFAGTSIAAVVERSGLPTSSIYWHFQSKEGLLTAVMEEGARRWFSGLPRWDTLEGTPAERHREMLHATGRALEAQPDFLRLLLLIALERRDVDPTALGTIRRVRAWARDGLRRGIEIEMDALGSDEAGAADDLARLALAVADGVFIAHHIDPDDTDITRLLTILGDSMPALVAAALAPTG